MMRPSVLPDSVVNFSDYFKFNVETNQVLRELGFIYHFTPLDLPRSEDTPAWVGEVQTHITEILGLVQLSGEASRRELLIAPVITRLARHLHAALRLEYGIYVSERLRGSFDYLLEANEQVLVIEAKDTNITRSFRQLAAEMIALDAWTESNSPHIYGAVTFGDGWQFGTLNRPTKEILQDTTLFAVPSQLEDVVRILLAMLTNEGEPRQRTM